MSGISFEKGLWSSIILMMFLVIPSVIRAEEKKTDEVAPPLQRVSKSLSAEDQAQGWLLLFDGKTFFGWEARPLIQLRPLAVPDPKIKMTRGEMSITTEIPIQVRTPLAFPSDWEIEFTYRTEGDFVGLFEIYRPDRTGSGVKSHAYAIPIAPSAESRTFTATPNPSDGSLLIDGIHVTKLSRTADRPGLSLAIEKGKIDIDSVRVRIPGASVASGTDLEGWRLGGESKAEVTPERAIHLTGGSGYLESEEEIADGFIRLEFQEKASPNNSGLFFRTIPGSAMDGYECQMNNNPPDGDREKFLGNDTGSVFRRAAARRVVADPSEWTGLTVMMDGNLFRTWVNGIPTLLWTDTRAPEENPRKGLRLAPGTIQIQGHDEGTDLLLRNLFVASLDEKQQERLTSRENKEVTKEGAEPISGESTLSEENAAFEPFRARMEKLREAGIDLTDYHIHLRGGMTAEKAIQRERETGIHSGVLENAGREWPLSDNEKLADFIAEVRRAKEAANDPDLKLPVGIQVNDRDWFTEIDPKLIDELDYVLADTMIMGTDENGKPQRLWLLPADYPVDPEEWMERYMAHNLQVLSEPITILANVTYLPEFVADRYDELWTDERMDAIIDKAVEKGIALEIQAESPFPKPRFIERALRKGAKFSFGTNNFDPVLKNLDRWDEVFGSREWTNDEVFHLPEKESK